MFSNLSGVIDGALPLHFPFLLQISFFLLVSFGLSPSCWESSQMSGPPTSEGWAEALGEGWGFTQGDENVSSIFVRRHSDGGVGCLFSSEVGFSSQNRRCLSCRSRSEARDWGLWGLFTSFQLHVLLLCLVCPHLKSPWSRWLWEWARLCGEESWLAARWGQQTRVCVLLPHLTCLQWSLVPCIRGLASPRCPPGAQITPSPTWLSPPLAHHCHFPSLVLTANTSVFLDCHSQESEKIMGDLPCLSDNFHAFLFFFGNPSIPKTEKAPRRLQINWF